MKISERDNHGKRLKITPSGIFILKLASFAVTLLPVVAPIAIAQGIFEGLPYSENEIREKIRQHTVNYNSADSKDQIPPNVYYRQVFMGVLSDHALLESLPSSDIQLIETLPRHDDERFVDNDRSELDAICKSADPAIGVEAVLEMATAFDESRSRRESDLNDHYARTLLKLTPATRQYVEERRESINFNVTYSTFELSELATEAPDIAKAILLNGCENFLGQQNAFVSKKVLLKDQ